MHIHRDYSMAVDYGSHIISFAVESEQELYSRLAPAVKRVLRHFKRMFDFSLMEHFLSMPNGMQHSENICFRWKLVHVTLSDWLWHYYQIIGFLFLCSDDFSFIFSKTLTA